VPLTVPLVDPSHAPPAVQLMPIDPRARRSNKGQLTQHNRTLSIHSAYSIYPMPDIDRSLKDHPPNLPTAESDGVASGQRMGSVWWQAVLEALGSAPRQGKWHPAVSMPRGNAWGCGGRTDCIGDRICRWLSSGPSLPPPPPPPRATLP